MGAIFDPFFESLLLAGRLTDRPDVEMQFGKMKGATPLVTPVRFVGEQINKLLDRIPEGSRPTARAVLNMVKGRTGNENIKNIIDEVSRGLPAGQGVSDVALDTLLARVPPNFRRAVKAHIRASLPSFFVDQPDIDKPTGEPAAEKSATSTAEASAAEASAAARQAIEAARVQREAEREAEREARSSEEAARAEREAKEAAEEAARLEAEAEAEAPRITTVGERPEQTSTGSSFEEPKTAPPTTAPPTETSTGEEVHHRGQNQTSHTYGVDFTAGGRPSQFTDLGALESARMEGLPRRGTAATSRPAPKKKKFYEYLEDDGKTQNFVRMVGDSNASYGAWINRYNIKYSTAPPLDPTAPIRVRT